jgi:AraC family transcriptional regulator
MAFVTGRLAAVIPAGRPHAIHCEHQSDLLAITLDPGYVERKAREGGFADAQLVERYAAADPLLVETGRMLREGFRARRLPSIAYCESLCAVLALHLLTHYRARDYAAPAHSGLPPHKLARVEAMVQERLAEEILVEQLAAGIEMSPYHFSRMFKRATGCTPHFYVTLQRVERAKELLRTTRLPLAQVAARVGFPTQGHFADVFQKLAGTTPRLFRMSCRDLDDAIEAQGAAAR